MGNRTARHVPDSRPLMNAVQPYPTSTRRMPGALGFCASLTLVLSASHLPAATSGAAPVAAEASEEPVSDNSFLIEEAYNQDPGVVQHINAFARSFDAKEWVYALSQEWPLWSQAHQLSYTIPIQHAGDFPETGAGAGDIALNYRYQLVGGDGPFAVAPRLTLLLPTGSHEAGRGAGGLGYQINLPVSIQLGKRLVTHWNGGLTYTPNAKNEDGDQAGTLSYGIGQSVVWLASKSFNLLVEAVFSNTESVVGPGLTERETSFLLNPGVRFAINVPGGLQIVPGVSVPIGVGPSRGESGIFIYLSFEHPFKALSLP